MRQFKINKSKKVFPRLSWVKSIGFPIISQQINTKRLERLSSAALAAAAALPRLGKPKFLLGIGTELL